jgi:hypothetical protein
MVGRYELVREIGRGGMAVVYVARQPDLDRHVALKELSRFHAGSPEFAHRFLRESRLAGSLNHPNIVTVHEYFEDSNTPYIAMEYISRGSLRPYMKRLTLAQIAGVLEGVLAALAHGEGAGIVHRDLKPENIMVTADGRVKITDFGIARATQRAGTQFMTATGMTVGTPTYMAPEQAMAGEIGPWTDLYSVGVLSYELVVGRPPFSDAEAPMVILMRHINERVPPPVEVQPDIDPRLSDWVDSLLRKDPQERVGQAAVAWDSLEEIIVGLLGPLWRRDARLLDDRIAVGGARPLTPAPFESQPAIRTPTPEGLPVPDDFVTFDPARVSPAPPPAPAQDAQPPVAAREEAESVQSPPAVPLAEPAPAPPDDATPGPTPVPAPTGEAAPSGEAALEPTPVAGAPEAPAPVVSPPEAPAPVVSAPGEAPPEPPRVMTPPEQVAAAGAVARAATEAGESAFVTFNPVAPPVRETAREPPPEPTSDQPEPTPEPPEPTAGTPAEPDRPVTDAPSVTAASAAATGPAAPKDAEAAAEQESEAIPEPDPVLETLAPAAVSSVEAARPAEPEVDADQVVKATPEPQPEVETPRAVLSTGPIRAATDLAPQKARGGKMAVGILAGVIAIAAAAVGFLVAPSSGSKPHDAVTTTRPVTAGPIKVSYPSDWTQSLTPPAETQSLKLANAVTLVPGKSAPGGALVLGSTTASNASLLPASFASQLVPAPQAEVVKLGGHTFKRYLDLVPHGAVNPESVYVLPTGQGVATAVCVLPNANSAQFAAACEHTLSSMSIHGKALPLGADPAYAKALSAIVTKLNSALPGLGHKLATAKNQHAQAAAAQRLSRAYRSAATAVAKLNPGPAASSAQAAIVAALARIERAYASLATAAAHNNRKAYLKAERSIHQGESALLAAGRKLQQDGYNIG